MTEKPRALTAAVLWLALAQTLLLLWKAALGALLSPSLFGEKMITMSGMALLTAAILLLCRKKGTDLHFLPQRVSGGWNASACAAGGPCGSARGCFRFGTLDIYWARSGRVSGCR